MPADEAIDLVVSLPPGSAYKAAASPDLAWSAERHRLADLLDVLLVVNWRLMGCPAEYKPSPIERPGDAEQRRRARERTRSAVEKIENTKWKEA